MKRIIYPRTWDSLLALLFFICLCTYGCSKSTSNSTTMTPSCSDDTCLLRNTTWEIDSIAIHCSAGIFIDNTNINQIPWSTFTFNQNLSFNDYEESGLYSWTGSDQVALTFPPVASPIHFNVTVSPTSLALATLTIQLHPQVDTSYEANGEVSNTLPSLHDQFQVDTSKLTYVQTTFYYSAKQ
jgi:hypothetical protein